MSSDFFEQYDIQKFESDISAKKFDCGDEDLNDFIKNEVQFYKEQLIAMPKIPLHILHFPMIRFQLQNLHQIVSSINSKRKTSIRKNI